MWNEVQFTWSKEQMNLKRFGIGKPYGPKLRDFQLADPKFSKSARKPVLRVHALFDGNCPVVPKCMYEFTVSTD